MVMELKAGFSSEVDHFTKNSWDSLLETFDDGNIYQTWSYEAVRSGKKKVSHLLLKLKEEPVALAQVRIVRVPFTNVGVAYLRWGPLWRRRGRTKDMVIFEQAVRALRNEYACRRKLVIRIMPFLFSDNSELYEPILKQEGFERLSVEGSQRTLLVGLDKTPDELRKGLDQKWRNRLKFAEKKDLEIVEGHDDRLFAQFIEMYDEMHARKRFVKMTDVHQYRAMQSELPDSLKLRISIAYLEGKPAAGIVCSRIGDLGICLFAATSDAGLSTQGSYLLQWKALGWLKESGAKWYDLAGINPEANPGTYRFKSGFCGKNGKDVHYLGTYVSHENSLADRAVRMANFTRDQYRKSRRIVNGLVYVPNGRDKQRKTG